MCLKGYSMADTLKLEIVTPEKVVVDEDVQSVMAPGAEGGFGVLPGHTTFLSTLKSGSIQYTDENGDERHLFVSDGFAEVLPDKMTVMVESSERRRDIDADRAQTALDRAQRRLSEKRADVDVIRAEAAMTRALSRLKIIEM
jgi:F-type H+-transporting ATPase subunit epsilon